MKFLIIATLFTSSFAFAQSASTPDCHISVGNKDIVMDPKSWVPGGISIEARTNFMLNEVDDANFQVVELNDARALQQEFSNPLNLKNGKKFLRQQNTVRLRFYTHSSAEDLRYKNDSADTAQVTVGNGIDQVDSGHAISMQELPLRDFITGKPISIDLTYLSVAGGLKSVQATVSCK